MYLHPFKNQYRDKDFSLISDTIKKYFPASKAKRLTSKTVTTSPGFKKIKKIVTQEFLNQEAYREKWGKLISSLEKAFKKPVYGHPDLSGGGFLGEVIIEEENKTDFIRKKALIFYVSILGPYFSIHGVDSSIALLEIDSHSGRFNKGNFAATHAITISPVFEYREAFNKLEDELRAFFPGYRFVPYTVGTSTVKNISIADELRDPRSLDTIYEGLFGLRPVHDASTRGDQYYGMSDWIKPFNKKEKSLVDLISRHIIAASKEVTLHKVWKLEESKRLDTFKVSGNLTFGMDTFDIIDLTDTKKFILTSKERGAPSSGTYSVKNNVIKLNANLSLRIADLSNTTLTLNLILNLEHGEVSLKGEVLEMKFVQMKKWE